MIEPVQDHFVMSDDDDCGPLISGDPPQQIHHDSGASRIERCGRLVGENNARPVGKRACDRHPLRFTARELFGQGMLAVSDLEIVEQFDGASA